MGKTTLACQIAAEALKRGANVYYLNYDSDRDVVDRVLSALYELPRDWRRQKIEASKPVSFHLMETFGKQKVNLLDLSSLKGKPPKVIIVDTINAAIPTGCFSRSNVMKEIVAMLQQLASEHQVHATLQLGAGEVRAQEGSIPDPDATADLRGVLRQADVAFATGKLDRGIAAVQYIDADERNCHLRLRSDTAAWEEFTIEAVARRLGTDSAGETIDGLVRLESRAMYYGLIDGGRADTATGLRRVTLVGGGYFWQRFPADAPNGPAIFATHRGELKELSQLRACGVNVYVSRAPAQTRKDYAIMQALTLHGPKGLRRLAAICGRPHGRLAKDLDYLIETGVITKTGDQRQFVFAIIWPTKDHMAPMFRGIPSNANVSHALSRYIGRQANQRRASVPFEQITAAFPHLATSRILRVLHGLTHQSKVIKTRDGYSTPRAHLAK